MDRTGLTARQNEIFHFIRGFIQGHGYPPSLREICARFQIKGPNNAAKHLDALERKGFIRRRRGLSRGIEVIADRGGAGGQGGQGGRGAGRALSIPIAGAVRAGPPELAVEDIVGHVTLDEGFFNCADAFILRVKGDSMTGAGMDDGDHVIVRPAPTADPGDIVVAMLDNEATVKRFFMRDNAVILKPENPAMKPITIRPEDNRDFTIIGKVMYVIKNVG